MKFCKKCNLSYDENFKRGCPTCISKYSHKYHNSEKGFITDLIARIFSPSIIKKRKYIPEFTKEEIKESFYKYVNENGRICFYCKEPWTYIHKKIEVGNKKRTKGKVNLKNFSIDRLDSSKTYRLDNIIFCCVQCNLSKRDISINLVKQLYKIITERNL